MEEERGMTEIARVPLSRIAPVGQASITAHRDTVTRVTVSRCAVMLAWPTGAIRERGTLAISVMPLSSSIPGPVRLFVLEKGGAGQGVRGQVHAAMVVFRARNCATNA